MLEDTAIPEENGEEETIQGPSGNLVLDGEAWKKRGSRTYTSLLDRYGAADLFSEESTERYLEMTEEGRARDEAMAEYLFSGQMQEESDEADLVEQVFSEKIELSRVRERNREQEDNTIYFAMGELLIVLIVLYLWTRARTARKKRRGQDAAEADMESEGKAGYGPVGI